MCYKNIAGRFFGLVTKHAFDRRTELRLPRPRWHSCVARQKPFLLLGLGAEYIQISTVDVINTAADRQKFDTHRRTKLTAPETISRSSDMVVPATI